jgi:hypothetical protein
MKPDFHVRHGSTQDNLISIRLSVLVSLKLHMRGLTAAQRCWRCFSRMIAFPLQIQTDVR